MKMREIAAALLVALQLLASVSGDSGPPFSLKALASQGIVVPKRSALISGLNSQFKVKANKTNSLLAPVNMQAPISEQQPPQALGLEQAHFRPHFNWLGARPSSNSQRRISGGGPQPFQLQGGLYLDRHQQEVLAANPNLLNPSASEPKLAGQIGGGSSFLLTRSDSAGLLGASPELAANGSQAGNKQLPELYRGFSLIELDVKSDSDRRFVQELYANLSLAINEQAQNPNAVSVSPYVDVDFWSFKYALNDQIDIMVSPKSRAFILNQLNRNKVRHRIKIDDIQSRLDQQQQAGQMQPPLQLQPSGSGETSISGRELAAGSRGDHLSGRQSGSLPAGGQLLGGRQKADNETISRAPMNESAFFENYQRLAEINQFLELVLERNRDVAQVKVIGRSSQGRYLRVLKLGYDQTDLDGSTSLPDHEQRRASSPAGSANMNNATNILESFFRKQESIQKVGSIWLDGGTHAREWISPATVLYIISRLSENHTRCRRFFDTLRMVVAQASSEAANTIESSARTGRAQAGQPKSASLDSSLLSGINEINSSLLGAKPKPVRPRTELEHTLELLAKSPQEVASEHACDLELEALLRRYTFLMMPVLNPDGYEYSHTHNRLWRKTRSQSNHPIYRHFCLGADPNRNYDARHGSAGSSTHPCSQTYSGTVPFTEPETRHQSNFVYANRNNMKMYISFHSYSQMILLPYSHSSQLPPDHKELESVAQAAVKAIERTHGTLYRMGPSAAILYTASGTASDWAYEKAGVKYSYTIELRDTGNYGFLLPRQQILPTGEETFNGLLAMIGQMELNERLLTSKSGVSWQQASPDTSHVPNLDDLNAQSRHKNFRPNLENLLQPHEEAGSSLLSGARDRAPSAAAEPTGSRRAQQEALATATPLEASYQNAYTGSSPYEPEPALSKELQLTCEQLESALLGEENELDAGYAFEGEGELLEPTRDKLIQADRFARESGRAEQRRRMSQADLRTAAGRNLINSPLLASRLDEAMRSRRRRESSSEERPRGAGER